MSDRNYYGRSGGGYYGSGGGRGGGRGSRRPSGGGQGRKQAIFVLGRELLRAMNDLSRSFLLLTCCLLFYLFVA